MSQSEAAIERYLKRAQMAGRRPRTIDVWRAVLRAADRDLPDGLLGADPTTLADDLTEWFVDSTWCPKTKATYYSHLDGFYRWAVGRELVDENPLDELVRPTVRRGVPRPAATAAVLAACRDAAEPFRTAVKLASYGGLRCCEIAEQRREEITVERMIVHGKGGKVATVPTHPVIWAAVEHLRGGLVVPAPVSTARAPMWVSRATRRHLRDQLGLNVTMHQFRHWFATESLRSCRNLRTVQELMRHDSPTSTAVYTLVTDEERRAAIATLPTFDASTPAAS